MLNVGSNLTSFLNLSTLKVSANKKVELNTQISSTTTSSQNSNEVLGYKVDKDGFFTAEFNEKAGHSKRL